jgi:predicted metal-dependent phosphotriesterase family hydrolase
MLMVETVRGQVDVSSPGQVLMHEHVFTLGTKIRQNYPDYPDPWDEEGRVADADTKLAECKSRGITMIVDPTVIGLRRCIPRIQRINAQVDINIVVATGIYTYYEAPIQFHFTGPGRLFDVSEPMVELFVAALAKAGYADRMVLAHDASCYSDFYGESYKTALLPRWIYTHIADDVLPALREHAVDEAQITAMLVHNPPATSPEARSEPDGCYRDFPHAQPLPASGCSG